MFPSSKQYCFIKKEIQWALVWVDSEEEWIAGISSQNIVYRQPIIVLSFMTLTFHKPCLQPAEHKDDPENCDPKQFSPLFSTRQVSRWRCWSIISNHGSVLAKQERWDKCSASSGPLVLLKEEDLETRSHPLASPWSFPVSWFEGRKKKKKMESWILPGPCPEESPSEVHWCC